MTIGSWFPRLLSKVRHARGRCQRAAGRLARAPVSVGMQGGNGGYDTVQRASQVREPHNADAPVAPHIGRRDNPACRGHGAPARAGCDGSCHRAREQSSVDAAARGVVGHVPQEDWRLEDRRPCGARRSARRRGRSEALLQARARPRRQNGEGLLAAGNLHREELSSSREGDRRRRRGVRSCKSARHRLRIGDGGAPEHSESRSGRRLMARDSIGVPRPAADNPLREMAFAALHRSTRELSIQRKIRLLPKIAGSAMFAILVMTITLGMLSRRSTTRIRDGYYPSARLSADLRERLAVMQRRLQDGVIAKDVEPFKGAAAQLDSALRELEVARTNPVVDSDRIDALRSAIRSYYTLARRTSERMVAGEAGDSIFVAVRTMTSQYSAVRRDLEANAAADEARIDRAFTTASRPELGTS